MAKARLRNTFANINVPRLAFRDPVDAKTQPSGFRGGGVRRSAGVAETTLTHASKSQSFKTVFLGDANVGKTCLAKLFVERQVVDKSTNTIGFDHHVKEIVIEGGIKVKLQVWDTAGMEQFRNALVTKYYRNSDGIVFVFDLTKRSSFESLEGWIKEVRQYTDGLESLKMILIGNKQDKSYQRQVSFEEAQAFADRYEMFSYYELSAKNIESLQTLDNIFTSLAEEMIANRERLEFTQSSTLRSGIISLSDDWDVLEIPEGPVPDSVYSPQEASIRLRARQRQRRLNNCAC